MKTSVVFPARASQALGFLKSSQNDIEIFVEDTAGLNMWLKLLRRYLPAGVVLNSVNILGSRSNVIAACKMDQAIDTRRKLYIIDGDMDLIRGVQKPKLKHLYRLRGYCIENYLSDERAFCAAVTSLNPQINPSVVSNDMDFEGWFRRNKIVLSRLFLCYAVTIELANHHPTVSYKVHRLLKQNEVNSDLCKVKVSRRIFKLYRAVRKQTPKMDVRNVFERIKQNQENIKVEQFVSGKDYLLPPLYRSIRKQFKINVKIEAFITLVAQCMEDAMDPYLLRRLRKLCH